MPYIDLSSLSDLEIIEFILEAYKQAEKETNEYEYLDVNESYIEDYIKQFKPDKKGIRRACFGTLNNKKMRFCIVWSKTNICIWDTFGYNNANKHKLQDIIKKFK